MPQSKHLNYYGFLGLFVALAALASFFLIRSKNCTILTGSDYDNLEPIHITGIITGGVLFLLGFFNIAGVLYDIKIIFFAVIVAILIVGGVLFWGAYIAFTNPCVDSGVFGINKSVFDKNAFDANDGHNIGVFVLDIIGGLLLFSIGFTFAKRL